MIYWDEFTGVFELPKAGIILTELQNIAELSINKGIFLFIVAHRRPYQTNIAKDDVEKILGRFKVLDYSMEPITTYHIINNSIKKIDKQKWDKIRNKYLNTLKLLIKQIVGNEEISVQKSVEDLFPIHPYTAYLATFVARNLGSTERSVFNFLHDEKYGFKAFIKENPDVEGGKIFLTSNYLWDFFYEDFERIDNEKVYSTLERFKQYNDTLGKKGDDYLSVFKGILLLNILYKVVEVTEASLVTPSAENIKNIFLGSIPQNSLNDILTFINERQIVSKNPDNLFLLTSSGLPPQEIEIEKEKLKNENQKIDQILDPSQKKDIKDIISGSVNRNVEIIIMDASLKEHLILNKLYNAFKNDYTIHLCIFLGKSRQDLDSLKNILVRISDNIELKNIILVASDEILSENELDKFFDYKARAIVAEKHNYSEEKINDIRYSKKLIDKWIENIKSGYSTWYLNGNTGNDLINRYNFKINSNLSKKIFTLGLENIISTQKNKNIWREQKSPAVIEKFLFSINREDLESKTRTAPNNYLRAILRDANDEYIVDSNLKLIENIPHDHPLKAMSIIIKKELEKGKTKGIFNLGTDLKFLSDVPYGLYPNMVNLSAISFLMREYTGKLFEAGSGNTIQKEMMRDKILQLFDFWQKGKNQAKLEVRFGSEEEDKLIHVLSDLFKLDDNKSLNMVRWGVREWIKDDGYPIWVYKSADSNKNTKKALDSIFNLIQSYDKELIPEKIIDYLNSIEPVKFDLGILIDKNDTKILFKEWLKNINKLDILPNDFGNIVKYIRKNMPEEVASWTEDKTREMVKDWKLEQTLYTTPDVTSPDVTSPDVTSPDVTSPDVTSPDVTSPDVTSPDVTSPDVTSPDVTSPDVTSPDVTSPDVTSPDVTSPDVTSPDVTSPDVTSPDVTSPDELII